MNCVQLKLKSLKYNVSGVYTKHLSSSCRSSDLFGTYYHRIQARINCNADENCIGVLERSCDNSGTFHLCKKGFITSETYTSSCVYKKKHHHGMYLVYYLLWFSVFLIG